MSLDVATEKTKITCPNMESCPLFQRFKQVSLGSMIKKFYCENKAYTTCQRFTLNKEGKHVPENLLPNGDLLGK